MSPEFKPHSSVRFIDPSNFKNKLTPFVFGQECVLNQVTLVIVKNIRVKEAFAIRETGSRDLSCYYLPSLVWFLWTNQSEGGGVCGKLTSCELRRRAAGRNLIHPSILLYLTSFNGKSCFMLQILMFLIPIASDNLSEKHISTKALELLLHKKNISYEFTLNMTFYEV